jgi:type VI secretion system secreted protein VgrG
MAGYTQTNRLLQFNSPLGANTLLAKGFQGTEEISELFNFEVDLLADTETVIEPSALVGKRVTVTLEVTGDGIKRYFNGIVASIEGTGGDRLFNGYRVRMVPMLWLLSLNRQTRVFQDMSVLDIVRKILAPYSITAKVDTQNTYQVLEYCTQYRETDLEFFKRLLEQHGIFFYFTHSQTDHTVVLTDSSSHCAECAVSSEFDYIMESEQKISLYNPLVLDFRSCSTLIAGEHSLWDYRFMHYDLSHASPQTAHSTTQMGDNSHELYDFSDSAAAYFKTEGEEPKTPVMQTRLQAIARDVVDAQSVLCGGASTASTMQTGFSFKLSKYPQAEKNIKYLLTRVSHSIHQAPAYHAGTETPVDHPYSNTFEARPFTQVYRKERTTVKPRVNGVVTGKVVTFAGEDSHLDRFGRLCVQFWWDRHRPPQTPDKTLLRVAQQWAGKDWGTYFWPRAGDEVLIDFIDGDPDAPIVVGSVYNGVNMPKYDPKEQYTRSGIRTRSSRSEEAGSANELRFDDLAGSEQVFIKARRDFDLHVQQDWHTLIDNEEHRQVESNQYHSVGGSAQLSVGNDQRIAVGGTRSIEVAGMQSEKIGSLMTQVTEAQISQSGVSHAIFAGVGVQISGEATVVLQTSLLYLMLGGVSLQINAEGLAIMAALNIGKIVPPDLIPPIVSAPLPVQPPKWPGDDPRK